MSATPPRPSSTRAKGGAGPRPPRAGRASSPSRLPWLLAGLVVVMGLAALVAWAPWDSSSGGSTAGEVAPVTVTGAALPAADGSGLLPTAGDPGVGKVVPALAGSTFGGGAITYPVPTKPTVYVFVAHWCPHCQAELPRIIGWLNDGSLPKTVSWRVVSTAVDASKDNFPPSAWLAKIKWEGDVLLDSEKADAATAFGLKFFPYLVFTDAQGVVRQRATGELPLADLKTALATVGA